MPSTADKRAQARRAARIQQAHKTAPGEHVIIRRGPKATRRAKPRTGVAGFIQRFPLATTVFFLTLVGLGVYFMYSQKLGPFYVPLCDLKTHQCQHQPPTVIDAHKTYTATIHTSRGNIVIALDAKNTPTTVDNFVYLSENHWYDNTYFWRVETPGKPSPIDSSGAPSPLSLIQGGSVADNGQDGAHVPGYTIPDELGTTSQGYVPGTVAMANTGQPNSGSAQFFIDNGDNTQYFSKTYTIFGKVTSGLDIAKKIQPKDKIQSITIAEK
jgi:cyclophilin family peptidyl-prolyl cis-trans isomerase